MRPFEFESIYDEHAGRVYSFLAYRLGGSLDAEDLTQATFERAFSASGSYDPRLSSPATWLLAIARNLLVDHLRARAARPAIAGSLDDIPHHREPTADIERRGEGLDPALEQALGGLRDRERELLALRYGADLTGPEIARLTGLSLPNVQQILSRSLRRLRAELEASEREGADAGDDAQRHEG